MATIYRITIPSFDIEASVNFYRKLFTIDGSRVSSGRHYFDCDGVVMSCYDAAANGDSKVLSVNDEYLYFAVDDVDAVYALAIEAGAELEEFDMPGVGPLGRVVTRPWGERSFYTRDPSGNPMCFTSRDTLFTGGKLPD